MDNEKNSLKKYSFDFIYRKNLNAVGLYQMKMFYIYLYTNLFLMVKTVNTKDPDLCFIIFLALLTTYFQSNSIIRGLFCVDTHMKFSKVQETNEKKRKKKLILLKKQHQ